MSVSINSLLDNVSAELGLVNQEIIKKMQSSVPLIPKLGEYVVSSGGKRIRPSLLICAAKICGYNSGSRHIALAACIEFIHTATLLHDDVVDESDRRRGIATANNIWGNQASVLVGDFLFSKSFELMVADGNLDILGILTKAASQLAEGEVAQLEVSGNLATKVSEYLKVIEAKTASLFAAATEVGAEVANADEEKKFALKQYGSFIGMAFQIVDDILDWSADQKALGKNIGDDFREAKITLPIIFAFEHANDAEKLFLRKCLEDLQQEDGDFEKAMQIISKYNCLNLSFDMAKEYVHKAVLSLDVFDDSELKSALINTANYIINRKF